MEAKPLTTSPIYSELELFPKTDEPRRVLSESKVFIGTVRTGEPLITDTM